MTSLDSSTSALDTAGPSVLIVCTGNVCRSPFAELLLRSRVPGLSVTSRGIMALEGQPMERQMAAELGRRGVSAEGFRARQVSRADMGADLILTMSRRQRSYLIEEFPGSARRLGLIGHVPQLALLAGAGGKLDRDVISQWSRQVHPSGQDVQDPYQRPPEVAAASALHVETMVEQLAPMLAARR